jgi:hypothetical protein
MDATSFVSVWNTIILQFCYVFTEPTARTWQQITLGWILKRGPATVTGIFRTLGNLADRHWTVYQKFFYRASWSLNQLSEALLIHVILPLITDSGLCDPTTGKPVADLNIDDTTVGRCGKHVAHAGWFKDASTSASSHKGTVIHWAHNWLVGAITLRLPGWTMRWVLPAVFALYRKRGDYKRAENFQSRQELAGEMIQRTAQALPEVQLRACADGQYAKRPVVEKLPKGVNLVSRIRRDAAIYQLPPKRRPKPTEDSCLSQEGLERNNGLQAGLSGSAPGVGHYLPVVSCLPGRSHSFGDRSRSGRQRKGRLFLLYGCNRTGRGNCSALLRSLGCGRSDLGV